MNEDTGNLLQRFLGNIEKRVKLLARRCRLTAVKDDAPVQTLDADFFRSENRSAIERIQEYGYSSVPLPGGQAIALFLGGEGSHPAVIATDDRRYRPSGLNPGDVMVYTAANSEEEHHIYLGRTDRFVRIRGNDILIQVDDKATVKCREALVEAESDITLRAGGKTLVDSNMECTGNIVCNGDVTDRTSGGGVSMHGMRATYNDHTHPENDHGGPTDTPLQRMG